MSEQPPLYVTLDERDKRIVALHAKLQGAFALLPPEDSERLGITHEMLECEDIACGLYEQHVRHAVDQAVAEERQWLRDAIPPHANMLTDAILAALATREQENHEQ